MTVDFLKVPLGLKKPVLKEVAVGPPRRPQPVALERYKARRSDAMDTESQYSGYSYKSGHSRSSRKHRWADVGATRVAEGQGGGGRGGRAQGWWWGSGC